MELADLHQSWKVYSNDQERIHKVTQPDISEIIKERSISTRSRLLKTMGIDARLMVLSNVLFIALLYLLDLEWKHLSALVITGFTFILFVHYHLSTLLMLKVRKDITLANEIRITLQIILRYIFIYKIIVPPFAFTLSMLAFHFNVFRTIGITTHPVEMSWQLTISLLFSVLVFGIINFIIKRSFQRDLLILEGLIDELNG